MCRLPYAVLNGSNPRCRCEGAHREAQPAPFEPLRGPGPADAQWRTRRLSQPSLTVGAAAAAGDDWPFCSCQVRRATRLGRPGYRLRRATRR